MKRDLGYLPRALATDCADTAEMTLAEKRTIETRAIGLMTSDLVSWMEQLDIGVSSQFVRIEVIYWNGRYFSTNPMGLRNMSPMNGRNENSQSYSTKPLLF